MGTSNISLEELKQIKNEHDWVSKFPQEEQDKLPKEFMERSEITKVEATEHNFTYFDIFPNRDKALEDAYNSLFD